MSIMLISSRRYLFLAMGLLLLMTTTTVSYGQTEEFKVKNTAREVRPGVYECVIYIEAGQELLKKIDDVKYTLPTGYSRRKRVASKIGNNQYPFSSGSITTTEEVTVKVKIDINDAQDVYLSYKIRLFNNP